MKEKNQKMASGVAVFLLIQWEQFSYSAEIQQALLFCLSICWCCMLWPCLVLCASVPLRTGDMGTRICIERGLGGIVVITPIAVEVWLSSWWNDRGHVGSGHGSCASVIVHGHVARC
jgi:hypothetical protein